MRPNLRPVPDIAQGSSETSTTRDRLALRSPALDGQFPEALDVEAHLLDLMAPFLRGVVGILAGPENATHLREATRGERHPHFWLLGRLATSQRPEAGAALDALVDYLARCRGRVVVKPHEVASDGLMAAVACSCKEHGEAVSAVLRKAPEAALEVAEAIQADEQLLAMWQKEQGK